MHKPAYRRSTYRPLSSAFFMFFGKCQKYSAIYMTAIFSLKERLKFIFITMTATTTNPQHHQLFPLAHESVSRQRAWNEILRKFIQIEWLCRFYENIVILPASASRTHINIKWICIKMLDLYVGVLTLLVRRITFQFSFVEGAIPFQFATAPRDGSREEIENLLSFCIWTIRSELSLCRDPKHSITCFDSHIGRETCEDVSLSRGSWTTCPRPTVCNRASFSNIIYAAQFLFCFLLALCLCNHSKSFYCAIFA